MIARVLLGLGSNLGLREVNLRGAVRLLEKEFGRLRLSSVYVSPSFFDPTQPPYYNLAVEVTTQRTPRQVLEKAHDIEVALGRPYPRPKDRTPRTIDIDLLLFDDWVVEEEDLTIPHPGLWDRAFFLAPLVELDPKLICPRHGLSLKQRLEELGHSGVYSIGPLELE